MALNWVMLPGADSASITNSTKLGFVPLPNERPLWHSSLRIQFALSTPRAYPADTPLNLTSPDGTVYLTNQRLIYLPKKQTANFQSFSAPLLNLHDSHLVMPWFGPNSWTAAVQPVPGGNITSNHAHIELKLTFKEGGAPDFTQKFEQIKERLAQVVDGAREANGTIGGHVDLASVHLDELPSYQDAGHDRPAPDLSTGGGLLDMAYATPSRTTQSASQQHASTQPPTDPAPAEAPPGYEEAQHQSVQAAFDRNTRYA